MFVNPIAKRDNTKFASREGDMEAANRFVNMNDRQIRRMAERNSFNLRDAKEQKRSIVATFLAIPVVSTIAAGILANGHLAKHSEIVSGDLASAACTVNSATEVNHLATNGEGFNAFIRNNSINFIHKDVDGINKLTSYYAKEGAKLSGKALAVTSCAAGWGAVILGVGLYNKIKRAAMEKSPGLKSFEQNNPVLSFITDIGILVGGSLLALGGLDKLADKSIAKNPEKGINRLQKTFDKVYSTFAKLDNTKLNTKVLPQLEKGVAKLSEHMPKLVDSCKFVLRHSIAFMLGLGILKMFNYERHNQNKINKEYTKLKEAQLRTSRNLTNILAVERDVLAQGQLEMAEDLNKAIQGRRPVSNADIGKIIVEADCKNCKPACKNC